MTEDTQLYLAICHAMINRALKDCQLPAGNPLRKDAFQWIMSDDVRWKRDSWSFSKTYVPFLIACENTGADVQNVRAEAKSHYYNRKIKYRDISKPLPGRDVMDGTDLNAKARPGVLKAGIAKAVGKERVDHIWYSPHMLAQKKWREKCQCQDSE